MNTKPALSLVPPLAKNPSPVNQDSDQKKPRLSLVPPLPNAGVNFPIGDFSVNFYDGIYEGETKDGVPSGSGVWVLDNDLYRCSYNGCWYEGKRVACGVWKENIRGKSFQSYRGFFDGDNKKWGYGTLVHTKSKLSSRPGRWKYFGMFDNDQMNGYGILVDQSRGFRSRYAGLFKNNRRHGFGAEIFFNDVGEILETIVGEFENDHVTGDITVTRPDGFIFTGNHERILQRASPQYLCEGVGVMINSVDSGFLGNFENGLVKGVKWRDIERNHPRTTYIGKLS